MQDPKAYAVDFLSYTAFPIEMLGHDMTSILATATAFLYNYDNRIFLVTNWHNLTGIDFNKKVRKDTRFNASPHAIRAYLPLRRQNIIDRSQQVIELYENSTPDWLIHPVFGRKVDVAAIELIHTKEAGPYLQDVSIHEDKFDKMLPSVSDTAYVLGFPYNLPGSKKLAIWKRASIAIEPDLQIDDMPLTIIDTATRPGMSGSPVIYEKFQIKFEKLSDTIGIHRGFLGVYSGRITGGKHDHQLGLVWKTQAINEIIEGNRTDNGDYRMMSKNEIKNLTNL